MAGKIKKIIEQIIQKKANNNQALINLIKTKLMLKGINPNSYTENSKDNPAIIVKLENYAKDNDIYLESLEEPIMNIKTAFSLNPSIDEAIGEIKNQIGDFEAKLLIFFASPAFDLNLVSKNMKESFKDTPMLGCSTAGEIITGKILKDSIVVMALNSKIIDDVKIEVIKDIREKNNVFEVFNSFEKYYNKSMRKMDFNKYVGLVLFDGLSRAEEKIMENMGDMTDVIFIGASAGDYQYFSSTAVFAEGGSYSDAAVVALIKPATTFDCIKTQSFCPVNKKLVATKVDTEQREVIEFNNKPAALAYAEAIEKPVENLQNYFMHCPLGLMIEGEPYVRSPQMVKGNSIIFYCNVPEGMELQIMESTDIVKDTRQTIQDEIEKLGSISGIINFNCILRTTELERKGQIEQYAEIFKDIPTVGFSTYGEEYIGHINQTATMLVFK